MEERLRRKLRALFPSIRNYQNLIDVIRIAKGLGAVDSKTGRNRGRYEQEGVKPYAIKVASDNKILDKSNPPKYWFVLSGRDFLVKKQDEEDQLRKELNNFYKHLSSSIPIQILAKRQLRLPDTAELQYIKASIEKLDLRKRISFYDKLLKRLEREKLYNKKFDYVWLGFRTKAAKYWLSTVGKGLTKLLEP